MIGKTKKKEHTDEDVNKDERDAKNIIWKRNIQEKGNRKKWGEMYKIVNNSTPYT